MGFKCTFYQIFFNYIGFQNFLRWMCVYNSVAVLLCMKGMHMKGARMNLAGVFKL